MDEHTKVFTILGKLYYDLAQTHEMIGQLRQQNAGQSQKIQELITANQALLKQIQECKCDKCDKCECGDKQNGPEDSATA